MTISIIAPIKNNTSEQTGKTIVELTMNFNILLTFLLGYSTHDPVKECLFPVIY